ncbi:MAG TPA: hypothetical protein ENF74_05475 [Firmicutes bacterium]|nr:hypothetical protein [Bacillota bacterium]
MRPWKCAILGLLISSVGSSAAQEKVPTGPGTLMEALNPTLRKWYVPQELYKVYGWKQWQYSNYAREHYKRYVDYALEGFSQYDIFGSFVTRGWKIYEWEELQPREYGSSVYKNPRYSNWFDRLLISSVSKGQYYAALSLGDKIRTTLTPLTFSKPLFDGMQLDLQTDKYSLTVLASRIDNTGTPGKTDLSPPQTETDHAILLGMRGTVQVGDFVTVGGTYVNAHLAKSTDDWAENSMKGQLTTGQNWGKVRTITIRISDDSPEDGVGAILFAQQIYIDGRPADLGPGNPQILGGVKRGAHWEVNGPDKLYLIYDISQYTYVDEAGFLRDVNWFKKVEFELVLANDYFVEITSNLQIDDTGNQIFLPVTRAPGNVKDGTNMQAIRFGYGLPTGNEILGVTLEIKDVMGFDLEAEYDVNRRFRRFPNNNPKVEEHTAFADRSHAFYLTLSKIAFPWYFYGEIFSIDGDYLTTMYIPDSQGRIYYDNPQNYWYEFVEDNDDQDHLPDWKRISDKGENEIDQRQRGGVFPGLDENNDLISDFNENMNYQPDYEEPFLRYSVDRPEFLFGLDMNHNTVIDRFENDDEPDYPYKRDHRGYNFYGGVEVLDGVKVTVGHSYERLLSSKKESRSTYGLFTLKRSFPAVGDWRAFANLQSVRDNIPDDLIQWVQTPGTKGSMQPFQDPLVAQNTLIGTFYTDFHYLGLPRSNFITKLKYEFYRQRSSREGQRRLSRFFGWINKLDHTIEYGNLRIQPRIKTEYWYREPFFKVKPKERVLTVNPSLILKRPLIGRATLELGGEYLKSFDFEGEERDFYTWIYAIQLSNESDYMGYKLTAKVGFRMEATFLKEETKSSSIAFVSLYAGAAD